MSQPLNLYKLVPCNDPPVIGEVRYAVWVVPMPGEQFGSVTTIERRVIWTGEKWAEAPSE